MLGVVFGLITAGGFALNLVLTRRGVLTASASQGVYVSVLGSAVLFVIAALLSGEAFHLFTLPPIAFLYLAGAGLCDMVIGRYSNYRAITALGANASSPVRALNVLFSIVMAIIFLNEHMTLLKGIGTALVIIAPLMMLQVTRSTGTAPVPAGGADSPTPSTQSDPQPAASIETKGSHSHPFVPRRAEGYFFGLVTAVGFGTSPLLIRAAIGGTSLSLGGGAVSFLTASVVLLAMLAVPGRLTFIRSMDFKAFQWFAMGGFFSFTAHMFRFLALGIAPVTIVSPLMQTSAIFVLVFSYLINRRTEVFGLRGVVAVVLAALGAALLVMGI